MTTAVPRARQTALGAYRLLLRSVAQTFKGDESTLLAAKKEIRQKFEDSRGMSDEKARSDLIYGEAPQLSLACFMPPSTPSSSFRTTGMTWLPLTRPFSLPPAKPPLSLSLSLAEAYDAAEFIKTHVVQAELNEEGHYKMAASQQMAEDQPPEGWVEPPPQKCS